MHKVFNTLFRTSGSTPNTIPDGAGATGCYLKQVGFRAWVHGPHPI